MSQLNVSCDPCNMSSIGYLDPLLLLGSYLCPSGNESPLTRTTFKEAKIVTNCSPKVSLPL